MTAGALSPLRRVVWPIIDAIWLLALALYVLAGVAGTSFHGDEAMQLYMSRDYTTALIDRQPETLVTAPPYDIDTDAHLRLINGSVNRYTIGLARHLAGYDVDALPPRPGWDWGQSYAENVATGHRPDARLLFVVRLPSVLFLCASVAVLFAIGLRLGGRPLAYLATALYALNPVILLNGRRAMQEGALLCFGLLVVLAAIRLSRRDRAPQRWTDWALLALAGALTLASKHSGIAFVASAYLWVFVATLVARRSVVGTALRLVAAGILTILVTVALQPALWNDPPARIGNLLTERQRLLDIQVAVDPDAPTTLARRLSDLIRQPFSAPPQHYEVALWSENADFVAEIEAYMASPWSGLRLEPAIALALTAFAGLSLLLSLKHALTRPLCAGLLAWTAVTAASLLINPLPWQRYYLPVIPPATLLAGIGILWLARVAARRVSGSRPALQPDATRPA